MVSNSMIRGRLSGQGERCRSACQYDFAHFCSCCYTWLVLHYIKSGFRCPALEAMRKAHDVELEKERTKFLDLLAKTHSTADLESLQKQHEYDAWLL